MKDDVISEVLRAENDYHYAIDDAEKEAEKYALDKRKQQGAHLEQLRADFHAFEKSEREKFETTLSDSMRKMDEENAAKKARLKACQIRKAEQISERLKKEVLSLYGDS